jgi:hypothetical protein
MRKVRDYDAELKSLENKARLLKARRIEQLGELVVATGANTLDFQTLAGVLLDAAATKDSAAKEAWRARGAAFFQRGPRKGARSSGGDGESGAAQSGDDPAPAGGAAPR